MGPSTISTLTSAREQLRALSDRQQAALASFFATQAKVDKARAALAAVDADQRAALAELVKATDPRTAASLAGVSIATAKEAAAKPGGASSSAAVEQ
jgi:hypothetical protein